MITKNDDFSNPNAMREILYSASNEWQLLNKET